MLVPICSGMGWDEINVCVPRDRDCMFEGRRVGCLSLTVMYEAEDSDHEM
jgi:hypothetical protein